MPILNRYLDWIGVMAYDYHGQWDKKTGHVAPSYYHPEDDIEYFNLVSDKKARSARRLVMTVYFSRRTSPSTIGSKRAQTAEKSCSACRCTVNRLPCQTPKSTVWTRRLLVRERLDNLPGPPDSLLTTRCVDGFVFFTLNSSIG